MTYTIEQFTVALAEAEANAKQAAADYQEKHGDFDACGFAWTVIPGIRSNSKVGKYLAANKISKWESERAHIVWNPGQAHCQSISVIEQGALAFTETLKQHGIEAYTRSRLD